MRVGPSEIACVARAGWTERTAMTDFDKLFTDGEAYERLMGCWSRLSPNRSWIGSMRRKTSDGLMLAAETAPLRRS
jgi:hypothetical protein